MLIGTCVFSILRAKAIRMGSNINAAEHPRLMRNESHDFIAPLDTILLMHCLISMSLYNR